MLSQLPRLKVMAEQSKDQDLYDVLSYVEALLSEYRDMERSLAETKDLYYVAVMMLDEGSKVVAQQFNAMYRTMVNEIQRFMETPVRSDNGWHLAVQMKRSLEETLEKVTVFLRNPPDSH